MAQAKLTEPFRNAKFTVLAADGPLPTDMIRGILRIRRDALGFLESCVARYGDLVAFPLPRTPVLLVNDPGGARHVLIENHRAYSKATIQYTSLSLVTGAGLLTSDGEVWRAHRRIARPAFHHGRLDGVVASAVGAGLAVARDWDAAQGRAFDVDAAIMHATLDVVGRTLLGADLGPLAVRVVAAVEEALRVVVSRAQSPVPRWVPTPSRARMRRAVATLDALCLDVVRQRRATATGTATATATGTTAAAGAGDSAADDLLAMLLAGGLSDREVRDEIVTAVIAGHETVASSLTWTLHLLAGAPGVQSRLRAELDAVLGETAAPTWDDLPRLTYTRAVVDEALRLYPPAWVVTRRAEEDDVVAGVAVPAGTLVLISPWLLHRREETWPDALAFDPDRFAGGSRAAAARTAAGEYLPFGAGPRLCIGRDLAVTESVLMLATLMRDRTIAAVPGAEPGMEALVTLRPKAGMFLKTRPRETVPGALPRSFI